MTEYYYQQPEEEFTDPYSVFVYAIRSPYTKESYFRRLRRFFDSINFCEGGTMDKRCNSFAYRGRNDPRWALSNILKFLYARTERVGKKEITASTLRNYFKTIKMFCEVTDVTIQWKKIARGICRLLHFNEKIPDIKLNIKGREKQLFKPVLRIFQRTETLRKLLPVVSNYVIQKRIQP